MPNRKRDSKGRFKDAAFFTTPRDHPLASAAVAAGAASVAVAGAFLWSRRSQIGEAFSNGIGRLNEFRAERIGDARTQEEISEEALTLKETGKKSKGPRGPVAQQDIKAGLATVS